MGDPRVFRADSGQLSFEGRFRVYFSRGQGRPVQLNGVKMGSRGGDDGRGANFSGYKHQGHLWVRTARAELIARASLSILRAQPAPRQVRLAEGSDISGRGDGVSRILNISRNYFGGGICVDATVLPRVKSRKKIRFRLPPRPKELPRIPLRLNRNQALIEWTPPRLRGVIRNFPVVTQRPLPPYI